MFSSTSTCNPPIATYRLQFNSSFRFKDAIALAPYLAKLGISHIYASPITRAKKGSPHGYDVVDPGQINPDLGTAEEFGDLIDEVRRQGMGWRTRGRLGPPLTEESRRSGPSSMKYGLDGKAAVRKAFVAFQFHVLCF